jgi:hypothetical protein
MVGCLLAAEGNNQLSLRNIEGEPAGLGGELDFLALAEEQNFPGLQFKSLASIVGHGKLTLRKDLELFGFISVGARIASLLPEGPHVIGPFFPWTS